MSGNFGLNRNKIFSGGNFGFFNNEDAPTNPPEITLNPVSVSVNDGDSVSFTANANNYDSVKWLKSIDGVNFVDASDLPNYQSIILGPFVAKSSYSNYQYKAEFKNGDGSVVTDSATLIVSSSGAKVDYQLTSAFGFGSDIGYAESFKDSELTPKKTFEKMGKISNVISTSDTEFQVVTLPSLRVKSINKLDYQIQKANVINATVVINNIEIKHYFEFRAPVNLWFFLAKNVPDSVRQYISDNVGISIPMTIYYDA